jgi:SAM-dependent methyltransferase
MAHARRYDDIGHGYARYRREDPALKSRIRASLGDARTVANVGAGSGSYEPPDLHVIAIEPSVVMAAQRPHGRAPAIRATAGALPLRDESVDAAMAIVSLHHWDDERERGVRELTRIARKRVVIVTYDAEVSGQMWLMRDYLPEVAALDRTIFPSPKIIAGWLGGEVTISTVPLARDTPDWMLGAYWAHPERVLDAGARAATSGFARMAPAVVERVVSSIERDLHDGSWDAQHGALRGLPEYDAGLRLIVANKP